MKIRIGTRGSKLALWQAYHVADLLQKGGAETEIVKIETKGDKILDVSIAKIGSKGVFTEEIEAQLAAGNIDIAVHSAKDMQSQLPEGFSLVAFTEREKVNDVLVSNQKGLSLKEVNPEMRIGTSSTRRVALLKYHHPHIKTVEVRGNLQTRLRKMEEGHCDALLLAYAGVHRMEYTDLIQEYLSLEEFIPAVGQGSVAIEVYKTLGEDKKAYIRKHVNHEETETRLRAERAFLKTMDGGCSIPVFGLSTLQGHFMELKGGIVSLDGQELIQIKESGSTDDPEAIGERLANRVLEKGGDQILKEIREGLAS